MLASISLAVIFLSPASTAAYLLDFQPAPFYSDGPNPHYYLPSNPADHTCAGIRLPPGTEITVIRVRSGPDTGSPPQALTFFNGDDCTDESVELIVRYYQIAGNVEQSVATDMTYSLLADGLESYTPGAEMQASNVYNLVQNIGYASSLWSEVVSLGLEPGDAAFRYRSKDPNVIDTEWRVVKGVVILTENPLPLEEVEHPDYSPLLNTDLLELPTNERLQLQAEYQALAEKNPAPEGVFIAPKDQMNPMITLGPELESEYNRKIKIGKIARKQSGVGPAGYRLHNPNSIEMNPLVPYEGQSILEDLEAQRVRTVADLLEDPDWDLYLPSSRGPR
ncbi:hypothetical protein TWF696_004918 [Orbilia brochopaga]|uniref:Uncharacterized protein n=1 Tax=Orbilia brochopaga TaxID=3140254 RepID=A0AAV9V5Q1_9PEZI